jgi:hypothetical protein
MRSIIVPPLDELRIQAPIRGATFETAKRAKKCERLFQRSAAGETDGYLPPVVVLGLVVGPARQLPQSPLPSLVRSVGAATRGGNHSFEGRAETRDSFER